MARMYFPQYARGRGGIDLQPGQTVLQHIRRIGGVEIDSECGGRGDCGRDIIRLERGAGSLSPVTPAEHRLLNPSKIERGQRLACQAKVTDCRRDITVYIPNFGKYTVLSDYAQTEVDLDPAVRRAGNRVIAEGGRDLGSFFQQWLAGSGQPVLDTTWTARPSGGGAVVTVQVCQRQAEPFTFPLALAFSSGEVQSAVERMVMDQAQEVITVTLLFTPARLDLDPDLQLLAEIRPPAQVDALEPCAP